MEISPESCVCWHSHLDLLPSHQAAPVDIREPACLASHGMKPFIQDHLQVIRCLFHF